MTNDVAKQVERVMQEIIYPVHAEAVRGTVLRVLGELEVSTPVKSGRARSNWNVSSAAPDLSTSDRTVPRDQSETIKSIDADRINYVSNGLPYIQKLNDGSSKQAPQNFVDIAVKVAIRNSENAIKRGAQ